MADRPVRASARPDDESQLDAARAGDRDAIESILRSHVDRVNAICNRLCIDRGDAEDAAQEALWAIARGLEGFDGRSRLSTWIYRVTTNACMDELRRRSRRPEPADPEPLEDHLRDPRHERSPEDAAVAGEERAALAAALEQLPDEFRVAVVLRDVADLEYAAIAEVTGVAIGTVRSRIARGRGRLADLLGSGTDPPRAPSKRAGDPRPDQGGLRGKTSGADRNDPEGTETLR